MSTHPMSEHAAMQYEQKVKNALEACKKVLDTTRNPVYPTESSHTYNDKYLLAEVATKTAVTAVAESFSAALPRWNEHAPTMKEWAGQDKTVTVRMEGAVECTFVTTADREVESATKVVETKGSKEKTTKVVTTITEHFWNVTTGWEICAYVGADPNDKVVLATGQGAHPCVTRGDKVNKPNPPRPAVQPLATTECEISWLLKCLSGAEGQAEFVIDRAVASCHTPRRNKEVDHALDRLQSIRTFVSQTANNSFMGRIFGVVGRQNQIQTAHTAMFSPVLAMFSLESPDGEDAGVTLSSGDLGTFHAEHTRSVAAVVQTVAAMCPTGTEGSIVTAVAAGIYSTFCHMNELVSDHASSVGAIEAILRTQLIAAIGKEVQPSDFAEYMDFHNRKLFVAEHAPERFCYAIRRQERYPDGTLSIETTGSGTNQPLLTSVVHTKATKPMKFALSAAAEVKFMGDRHVHAAIMHSFSGQQAPNLKLVARARQFSSFVLLAGKIQSGDQFEPTAAMIVQNKDDVSIPLLLETIPTPKEFKDAIASMSPEQQRFAKAYRSLQLSSTLFGVCIIQIKPQLERVLNLPDGSLTKEIQLTQDLMELFIKYQVPSDLLSFDGADDADPATKVPAVAEHVSKIKEVIQSQRDAELQAAAEEKAKALLERQEADRRQILQQQQQQQQQQQRGRQMQQMACAMEDEMSSAPMAQRSSAPMARSMQARPMQAAPMMMSDSMDCAPPPPSPKSSSPDQPQPQQSTAEGTAESDELDYTTLPALLDAQFEALDVDSALRPTIIKIGPTWTKTSQAGLLSKPKTESVHAAGQKDAKNAAFDLLDALTRSGALVVDEASLHVVLAATHCFDKTVVNAVVQDNINPVEKVERSMLIVSSAITGKPVAALVQPAQLERVGLYSPMLFPALEGGSSA